MATVRGWRGIDLAYRGYANNTDDGLTWHLFDWYWLTTIRAPYNQAMGSHVSRITSRLVRQFNPERVILFGSRGRRTHRRNSDVDLLVIMPVVGRRRDIELQMRLCVHDIHVPKDIVLLTREEMNRQRHVPGTIARAAWREGRSVYVRGG